MTNILYTFFNTVTRYFKMLEKHLTNVIFLPHYYIVMFYNLTITS